MPRASVKARASGSKARAGGSRVGTGARQEALRAGGSKARADGSRVGPGVRREALRREALRAGARGSVVGGVSPRVQVSEMQRARLLGAAVALVDEFGYGRVSVAHITARARVSRRTFYDLFSNREDCLLAVLDDTVEGLAAEISAVGVLELGSWCERVRMGLWTILCFFDREPALARMCVVQSARGGLRVSERREEIVAMLAVIVDEGRCEGARVECPALTAEGLVGAVLSILDRRLSVRGAEPLSDLLGDLMSLLVLPYLGSAAARRERRGIGTFSSGRKGPAAVKSPARLADVSGLPLVPVVGDPLAGVPMRLTYRTARVLEDVAEHPGRSNRAVAEHAGITDQGQISKLLARLERIGLLENAGAGHTKGEPNEWRLTPLGLQVTQSIRVRDRHPREVA